MLFSCFYRKVQIDRAFILNGHVSIYCILSIFSVIFIYLFIYCIDNIVYIVDIVFIFFNSKVWDLYYWTNSKSETCYTKIPFNRSIHLRVWLFNCPIATMWLTNMHCIWVQNIFIFLSLIAQDNLYNLSKQLFSIILRQGFCVHAYVTEHWMKRRQRKLKKFSVLQNTCNHHGHLIGDMYK